MIISIVHFHNYSVSIREVKQVAVYAKVLESCRRRAQTGFLAQVVLCLCVFEREREGQMEGWGGLLRRSLSLS